MTLPDASFFFPAPLKQKFCTNCGHKLTRTVIPGDNRERDVCLNCGATHYKNPLVVVGTLPIFENKILLCKRAIEPCIGKWTFPSGFMERDESTEEGAARETLEESGATVQISQLFCVIDVPRISQVHIYYLARPESDFLDPGIESLEAHYFELEDIPWDELAFESIRSSLKHYVNDLKQNNFKTHRYTIHGKHPS